MARITKDRVAKLLLGRNDIFASVFNLFLYDGEPVIRPEDLKDLPTEGIVVEGDEGVDRMRDLFKAASFKEGKEGRYLLLGIENQSHFTRDLVFRIMLYDAIAYIEQIESGRKGKLVPSITIIYNCSSRAWNRKEITLYDSLEIPLSIRPLFEWYCGNHHILTLDPYTMPVSKLEKLAEDLEIVTKGQKYSKDKDEFIAFMSEERMRSVDELVFDAIKLFTGDRNLKKIRDEKGNLDMCIATAEIAKEREMQWKAEGRQEAMLGAINALMQSQGISQEEAMDALKIPASEREAYR